MYTEIKIVPHMSHLSLMTHHATIDTGDDLLKRFWEIEEQTAKLSNLSPEERSVAQHFQAHHSRNDEGRFIVLVSLHGKC